ADKPKPLPDAPDPSEQVLARRRLAGSCDRHDGVEALGKPVAPAAGKVLVEMTVEQGQKERGDDDDEGDPGIGEQMAGLAQPRNHIPKVRPTVLVDHDALTRIEPWVSEVD